MKGYWKLFLSVFTFGGILLGVIKELCGAMRNGIKNIIREDEREKKRAKQEAEYKRQREARQREWEQRQEERERQREQRQREWEERQEKRDQERIQRKIEEQEKFLGNEEVEFKEINGIMHFKNQKGHWVPCSINTVKNKKKK